MPTLNLLNSITPTGEWATDSIAPYNMQPYDFSLIQTNVVLDAANPILEITNIPVGAMIANPPATTAPYDSSFIRVNNNFEATFKVINNIPTLDSFLALLPGGYTSVISSQQYLKESLIISANINVYLNGNFYQFLAAQFQLQSNSIQNNILIGDISYMVNSLSSTGSLIVNEIASSYSVVSTDIANRKATIRVNGNIDNLKPPLNRLFLNFDKTP